MSCDWERDALLDTKLPSTADWCGQWSTGSASFPTPGVLETVPLTVVVVPVPVLITTITNTLLGYVLSFVTSQITDSIIIENHDVRYLIRML